MTWLDRTIVRNALVGLGLLVFLLALTADWYLSGEPGFGVNQAIAAVAGLLFATGVYYLGQLEPRERKYLLVLSVATYIVFEVIATAVFWTGALDPLLTITAFEESGQTVHFDPCSGYRLTVIPSRTVRITNGTREYLAVMKGNNRGFADRDDFYSSRPARRTIRYAVLGDSFTAATHLSRNWPDYVEDLAKADDLALQLLNFSQAGAGIANWVRILTELIEAEKYEIDGIVFAVYGGDLRRRFTLSDHRVTFVAENGLQQPGLGRLDDWDVTDVPVSLKQATPILEPLQAYVLTRHEFEGLLSGEWTPPVARPLAPYFAHLVWRKLAPPKRSGGRWDYVPAELIARVRGAIERLAVPVLVLGLPDRAEATTGRPNERHVSDINRFARSIGAQVLDGRAAFRGLSEQEVRSMWLPYDGHWGQGGSDHFGRFVYGNIRGGLLEGGAASTAVAGEG